MKIMKSMKKGILFNVDIRKTPVNVFSRKESAEDAKEYLCAPSALCERIIDLYWQKKLRIAEHWSEPDNQIV